MTGFSRMSALLLILALGGAIACSAGDKSVTAVPSPTADAAVATTKGERRRWSRVVVFGAYKRCFSMSRA